MIQALHINVFMIITVTVNITRIRNTDCYFDPVLSVLITLTGPEFDIGSKTKSSWIFEKKIMFGH